MLGERGEGATEEAGPGDDSRLFSGGSSGARFMTALVRAERIAAFTTSRIVESSISFGCMRSAGVVQNVPTDTSSSNRTTE
ncbi:MAG: hypothetical protein EOO73_18060 [Myxococcales bacterium]|nr:MAG: hypothetical protein EOO73_18060 [Myxococcales bacterium]